jgi:FSR family fosmidomycin resistance protein-like MFS transporter
MSSGVPSIIFWIAVGLYLVNAALVMAIRQTTAPTVVRTAAAE